MCGGSVAKVERIALIGFSGAGKTTVARLLADRLGWAVVDTDDEIERQWGRAIPAIFREHGETAFRASEQEALSAALARSNVVIATGGGAVAEDEAWGPDLLGRGGTLTLALDASPETMLARLRQQAADEGETVERPMLAGADPLSRIRSLKESRQVAYDAAHLTMPVDHASPETVASELEAVVQCVDGEPFRIRLEAKSGSSEIIIAPGVSDRIGEEVRRRWPKAQRAWVVTDANVGALYVEQIECLLAAAGFSVLTHVVAPGEGSKSLGTTSELYDWMLGNGVERGDVIIALGGGVVGDLAGFVAATVLRGIGLVQIPTSLVAAVDSSVGGKTGINHRAGKNLIGAFLQPPLVLVDTNLLRSLPPRELGSGWGEVVKHAVIQKSTPGGERDDLRAFLERNAKSLKGLREPATAYMVWRNIGLKAAVVAEDEREAGIRAYLNFGHTLGHAIEAADYKLLHGEAVGVGMRAASELGVLSGTCMRSEAERIQELVSLYDLPRAANVDTARVLDLLKSDKKRIAGKQRYVLPLDGGGVTIRDDVADDDVGRAMASVAMAVVS
jgi:shikimate kinase/3-dehydroquinate synthase